MPKVNRTLIERINELAHASKERELTAEEKAEQAALRKEYLAAFRANFRARLEAIEFVEDAEKSLEQAEESTCLS